MRALHRLNPVRIAYVRDLLARHFTHQGEARSANAPRPLAGLSVLDIGCGGGILAEPLARLGATVTGIDPGKDNIVVAAEHAQSQGLAIDYRIGTTFDLAGETFDAVLAMEVVEHAPEASAFVASAAALVRPGGLFIGSTLNRTLKSFALAIVGAEYLLGWLPRGTHRWEKFVTPREFAVALADAGLVVFDQRGVIYDLLSGEWRFGRDLDVNYLIAARKSERIAAGTGGH
jgi:2-polyprenyl-6-hydroxyphenyl methylase/3-demethylubiquinone-9 3-methyltransferase